MTDKLNNANYIAEMKIGYSIRKLCKPIYADSAALLLLKNH